MFTSTRMQLLAWFLQVQTPSRSGGCGSENHLHAGYTYIYKELDNTTDQVYTLEHKILPSPHNHQEDEDLFRSRREDGSSYHWSIQTPTTKYPPQH